MKTRKVPKFRKEYKLDLWTVRAIQMAMLQEGENVETEMVARIIKQVLKHKRCQFAKNYSVDKRKKDIQVFCGDLGNWVDVRQLCLGNCLMREFKTGKRESGGVPI